MKKTITLLTILFFMAGSAITAQNIIYVAPNGTGNGSSWATATGNLQAAIDSAATQTPKPDIWVAAGIYYGDSIAENNAFTMADGVDVYGGFAVNDTSVEQREISDLDSNGIVEKWEFSHPSILDGQHVQRVLYQSADFTDRTTWDGFTIQNGKRNFNNAKESENGGGVYLRANSVLVNSNITNNISGFGGGVYAIFSTLSSCNITNNTSIGNGGGAYFSDNTLISYCNISNNTSGNIAGGVSASSSILNNCNITNNISNSSAGGMSASSSILNNCKITNNASGNNGGGIETYYSTLNNCIITNNISSGYAGGVVANSHSQLINCNIINNQCDLNANGGGVFINGPTVSFTNCIIWGNKNDSIPNQVYENTPATISYCAIEGGYAGIGNIILSADNTETHNSVTYPLFVKPSIITGVDTVTQDVDWHLREGSACIDAGTMVSEGLPLIDYDGNMRTQNGRIDIGAYEYHFLFEIVDTVKICISELPYHYINGQMDTIFQIGTSEHSNTYFEGCLIIHADKKFCTALGCDSSVTLTLMINPNPSPNIAIFGKTEIVSGETTTLTASGAVDYLWSTMETTPSIFVTPTDTTLFTVIGTDENGCLGYDTIIVNVATGIAHYDLSNNILLFPNPATNFVELQITNDKLIG